MARFLVVVAAAAALVIAVVDARNSVNCCYTLSSDTSARVHAFEWTLGGSFNSVSQPIVAPGALRALDDGARVPHTCRLVGAQWSPNGAYWLALDLLSTASVIGVRAARLEFGPYVPNTSGALSLRYKMASSPDAVVSLHLECDDNDYRIESCALFQLSLNAADRRHANTIRDAGAAAADAVPALTSCARSASPSASHTPSTSQSRSSVPTPSLTPMPSYGNVYRAEVALLTIGSSASRRRASAGGIARMDIEFSLCYECLRKSDGATGAQFCTASVRVDGDSRHGVLVPVQQHHARRRSPLIPSPPPLIGQAIQNFYDAQMTKESRVEVTVVWDNGGYCRFDVDMHDTVRALSCRVIAADGRVHEGMLESDTLQFTVTRLDSQRHVLCTVVPTPSPSPRAPSASPAPSLDAAASAVVCTGSPAVEPDRPLYAVQSVDRSSYAELTIARIACGSNGTVMRYVFSRCTPLYVFNESPPRQLPFVIDPSRRLLRFDDAGLALRVDADTGVVQIISSGFVLVSRMRPISDAKLLE